MTLLACNVERTDSILRAHGVVCACVCGVVCINVRAYLCVACACVCSCLYMCISVYIHVCKCLANGGYKSTDKLYLQNMCLHVSVITQAQNNINSYSFGKF